MDEYDILEECAEKLREVQKKMEDVRRELEYYERKAGVRKRTRQLIQFD